MKKLSIAAAFVVFGLMSMSSTASAFDTTACSACHLIGAAKVGPSFKDITAAYGNEKALSKVFQSGFAVKDRKVAAANPTWAKKAAVMTAQFKVKIKGHEKEAAHAVFATVKKNAYGDY